MKNYFIISGLSLDDNNRGTAALGYGSFIFLKKFHPKEIIGLNPINFIIYKKPWKYRFKRSLDKKILINKEEIILKHIYIWFFEYWIYKKVPFLSQYTKLSHYLRKVSFIAAINGGDGFSDIYGTETFKNRLFDINIAIKERIPLILLPQTLGPFKDKLNLDMAKNILKYASKIYVRDTKFESELLRMNVPFELTEDLSYYMEPESFDINILPNAVGLNVSGLCYSNKFKDLTGFFDNYPLLITRIIKHFQDKNIPIYLVSHSYNYRKPEETNDDLQASKEIYKKLENKYNVYLIDKDLTSPQTKYIISNFKFFVGTRMHANFAAIFMKTPLFGLAYSYKYEGAFNYMGLKGHFASVLNIKKSDIDQIIMNIDEKYNEIKF